MQCLTSIHWRALHVGDKAHDYVAVSAGGDGGKRKNYNSCRGVRTTAANSNLTTTDDRLALAQKVGACMVGRCRTLAATIREHDLLPLVADADDDARQRSDVASARDQLNASSTICKLEARDGAQGTTTKVSVWLGRATQMYASHSACSSQQRLILRSRAGSSTADDTAKAIGSTSPSIIHCCDRCFIAAESQVGRRTTRRRGGW